MGVAGEVVRIHQGNLQQPFILTVLVQILTSLRSTAACFYRWGRVNSELWSKLPPKCQPSSQPLSKFNSNTWVSTYIGQSPIHLNTKKTQSNFIFWLTVSPESIKNTNSYRIYLWGVFTFQRELNSEEKEKALESVLLSSGWSGCKARQPLHLSGRSGEGELVKPLSRSHFRDQNINWSYF